MEKTRIAEINDRKSQLTRLNKQFVTSRLVKMVRDVSCIER